MEKCFYSRMAKSSSQKERLSQHLYQKVEYQEVDKEAKDQETSKRQESVLQPAIPRKLHSACIILLNDFRLAVRP